MPLHFLAEDLESAVPGAVVALTGAEAHHAATVRRIRVGEEITVGDGRGIWLTGIVRERENVEVRVEVTSRTDRPRPVPALVLVQALAKGDRDELAVQAAVELGVDEIVPWQAARSVSRWDAQKARKGRDRWAAIAREAAKQAHRAWLPAVGELATTAQLLQRFEGDELVVLEPSGETPLAAAPRRSERIVVVVGPEGGIDPAELRSFADAGAAVVRLGDTVLRTSTAGPAALAVLNVALGRW